MAKKLEQALRLAATVHEGQLHGDEPYVLHPVRVAMRVLDAGARHEVVLAALLHDAVEDTHLTLDGLRGLGYPEATVGLVDLLTHREGEARGAYLERLLADPEAVQVKLADNADNAGRLDRLAATDPARAGRLRARYGAERRLLEAAAAGVTVG
jgi:(p)ppGpp synthase/HD superfamily hydrolase